MAMKEVQYINNYPICDAEARNQLANKEDKGHKHEEYATSAEVQQIFNSIDISDFDMSDYATKEDVEDAVANIEMPEVDLSNYATKDYVAEQIVNADPDIDLSNYAEKSYVDEAINNIKIDPPDLSDYALKSEIPTIPEIPTKVSQLTNDSNFVTQEFVEIKIAEAELGGSEIDPSIFDNFALKTDLNNYALKSEIPEPVEIPTKVSTFENDAEYISYYDLYLKDKNGDYLMDEDGNYIIEDMVSTKEMENYVNNKISNIEGIDMSEIESRVSTVENGVSTVKGDMTIVKSDISNVKSRISTAESEVSNAKGRLTNVENKLNNYNNEIVSKKVLVQHESGYSPRASMGTWSDEKIGYVSVSEENSETTTPAGLFYMSPWVYYGQVDGYRLTMTYLNATSADPYTTDLLFLKEGCIQINSDVGQWNGVADKYLLTVNGGASVQALRTRTIKPESTGSYNIGAYNARYSNLYVDTILSTNNNVVIGTCDSSTGEVNKYGGLYINSYVGCVRPSASGNLSLGDANTRFHTLFCTNEVNVNSDARLKRNINYFEDQEIKTMSKTVTADDVYNFFKDEIKIATYDMIPKGVDYKTVPENEDWGEEGNSTVGFIAQDIQDTKVGKLFVDENEEGILSYNSGAYQSLTVLALQKALKKIEELENRIHELENK